MKKNKRGMTLIEIMVVIAQISILSLMLLPVLSRAREASRRASCVNNLKQFGIIFKMYSNESKGEKFPPGRLYAPYPRQASFGFDSAELYPEYWQDPELARCPSDIGGDVYGEIYGIEEDFGAQIERIQLSLGGTEQEYQYCLHSKLSTPISYCYTPYLATSMSQLADIHDSQTWAMNNITGTRTDLTDSYNAYYGLTDVDPSCTGNTQNNGVFASIISHDGFEPGQHDIPEAFQFNLGYGLDDDGTTLLNTGYKRLAEGLERFLITDINNPAASAMGQSSVALMWDAYAYGQTDYKGIDATNAYSSKLFNHIPDGSNVLFMDGHVEFVGLNEGYPLNVTYNLAPNSIAGSRPDMNYPNFLMQDIGNWGGFG